MLRVLLTGGGTGGHVYPLLSVTDALARQAVLDTHGMKRDLDIAVSYVGPAGSFDADFKERQIAVHHIASSKLRRYFSFENIVDIPKFFWSVLQSLVVLYRVMPDVVFSKGGPGALAVVLAARFYLIPVIIHESDAVPGLTNRFSARFAKRIAVAFEEAKRFFPASKTAVTGNPLRREFTANLIPSSGAKASFHFDPKVPTLLVLGGSQGAAELNNFVVDHLKAILEDFQVIHQAGEKNLENVRQTTRTLVNELGPERAARYRVEGAFDARGMALAFSAADVVISRSGSVIFEIAAAGKPSFLVPLGNSANGHQKEDALAYARTGAAVVFENDNFTVHVVLMKLKELLGNESAYATMADAAKKFARVNAASLVAEEIVKLGLRAV